MGLGEHWEAFAFGTAAFNEIPGEAKKMLEVINIAVWL
jgi:hypothetical protein